MRHKLIEIQKREQLTDTDFAAKLGVTREWWNKVKNGNEPLTANVQLAAIRTWPELLTELAGGAR